MTRNPLVGDPPLCACVAARLASPGPGGPVSLVALALAIAVIGILAASYAVRAATRLLREGRTVALVPLVLAVPLALCAIIAVMGVFGHYYLWTG